MQKNLPHQETSRRIKDCIQEYEKSETISLKLPLPFLYKSFFNFCFHFIKPEEKENLFDYVNTQLCTQFLQFHIVKEFYYSKL